MRRRDISSALFTSTAGSIVSSRPQNAQNYARLHFPETVAEIVAEVPIANSSYAPGCVDRYCTNVAPGTTSMVLGFNSAIKQAQNGGAQVTYGATAPYFLDSPINCTFAGPNGQHGVVIRNIGDNGNDIHSIIAKHTGVAVFDCTGTQCVEFYDVVIGTDPTTYPQTGVLWARNSNGGSLFHKMQNCRIRGHFSVAPLYNYGAESDTLVDCYFANYATTAWTKAAVWTSNNISGLKSVVPGLIATGQRSCIDHNCFGNQYYNKGGTSTSDCIYLEQADSWKNFGGWAYSASLAANGRSLVYVDMTNAASNFGLIEGLTGEVATQLQAYGVYFSNHPRTPTGWRLDSCRFPNEDRAIFAGSSVTLDNFHITNISEPTSRGLMAGGTVQNSVINTGAMLLNIGKSKNNAIIGHSECWSIATRNNDAWIDHGDGNKVWAANTDALTIEGTLDKRAICSAHGPLVTINLVFSASTSIRCSKGIAITGLPFAASDYSANVLVTNVTQQKELPAGYIEGVKLHLPAIDVGADKIVVTATYFAA